MALLTLDEAKNYLRIMPDETDEDTEIQGLIDAAEAYLLGAGCTLNPGDALAILAEKMLVTLSYENRLPVDQASNKISEYYRGIILQLQNTDPVGETP